MTIPGYVHKFELTKVSTAAVTYHLRPSPKARDGHAYHIGGWAIATVNDETGELAIQSDWGNWSFRWNINHLGERDGRKLTLTEFIGGRRDCHYIADKLSDLEERAVFDVDETIKHMRKELLRARLEQAREWIEYYRDDDEAADTLDVLKEPPHWATKRKLYIYGFEEHWPLDRETTRTLYDALGELTGHTDERDFVDAFFRIHGHQWISEEPWNGDLQHRPAPRYMQLLHGILPALIEACAARVAEREAASADQVQAALDRGDDIGALCALVEAAGGTMRLHGKVITRDELLVDAKPEPTRSKVDLSTWARSKVRGELREVLVSPDGEVVILGAPEQVEQEADAHNCDASGCGTDHVLWRGHVGRRLRRSEICRVRAAMVAAGAEVSRG